MMRKYILNNKIQIIIAILLAIIVGTIFNGNSFLSKEIFKPVGDVFLNLIKCFMIPLIFFNIIMGILNLESINKIKKIGVKILIFFIITTILASGIGLCIGSFFDFKIENLVLESDSEEQVNNEKTGVIATIFSFIPNNFIGAFVNR